MGNTNWRQTGRFLENFGPMASHRCSRLCLRVHSLCRSRSLARMVSRRFDSSVFAPAKNSSSALLRMSSESHHEDGWYWVAWKIDEPWGAFYKAYARCSSLASCGKMRKYPACCTVCDRIQYAYTCQDGKVFRLSCDICRILCRDHRSPSQLHFVKFHNPPVRI